MPLLILITAIALASCGNGSHPGSGTFSQRIYGPDPKTLPHDQLIAILHECRRYGASDDPRVAYTVEYCSAVQSAHSIEGYAAPSSAVVDPSLNKLH